MSATAHAHAQANNPRVDIDALKVACAGRWREILATLGGVPADHLDSRRQHPCPRCGGDTRFRAFADVDQTGGVICHHCHDGETEPRNGDGIAAIQWLLGCDFPEAVARLAEHVGLSPSNGKPAKLLDPLESLARDKRVSVDGFLAFGATIDGRNVAFPCYGPDGEQCTTFRIWAGDKGKFEAGKPAGLFFPQTDQGNVRLPQPGETWHAVEGVKDAAALHDLGYLTVGLNTCELAQKFVRLFRGCHIVFVPDRDSAGENGAKKSASRLRGHAASVRVATLPAEYRESGGDDVRDVLAKRDGEAMLREAIEAAVRVDCEAGDAADSESGPSIIVYESLTLADLEHVPEPEYFCDGLLERSQPGVIAGQYKSQKTTIAIELSYCLATGEPILGQFPVNGQYRVGMFSGEAGPAQLRNTVKRIAASHGDYSPWHHPGLILSTQKLPKIGDIRYMDALVRWIDQHQLDLAIIDPGYAALAAIGNAAGNYYAVADLLFQITDLQRQTGCTMLLAPHMTKAPKYDPPMLSDIQWSGFSEWAGQWLLMGKRREWDDQTGSHWLWMVAGGRSGHASTWGLDIIEGRQDDDGGKVFIPTLIDKAEAFGSAMDAAAEQRARQQARKREQEQQEAREAIRAAFRSLGDGWQIKAHIIDRTGKSEKSQAVKAAWAEMLRCGEIIHERDACRGGKNVPCDGYKLPQ